MTFLKLLSFPLTQSDLPPVGHVDYSHITVGLTCGTETFDTDGLSQMVRPDWSPTKQTAIPSKLTGTKGYFPTRYTAMAKRICIMYLKHCESRDVVPVQSEFKQWLTAGPTPFSPEQSGFIETIMPFMFKKGLNIKRFRINLSLYTMQGHYRYSAHQLAMRDIKSHWRNNHPQEAPLSKSDLNAAALLYLLGQS